MMCDFKRSTERVGLNIHRGKTNNLRNQSSNMRREVAINNIKVEVLPVNECAKYLGHTITFQEQETTRRQQKSGVEFGQPGRRSTDTNRS